MSSVSSNQQINSSEILMTTATASNNQLYGCSCVLCQDILSTVNGQFTTKLTDQQEPISNATNGQPYYVDALLFSDEPRWNRPNAVGTPVTVTYSFMTAIPGYYTAGDDEQNNFVALNAVQENAAERAFDLWQEAANIRFAQIEDMGDGGQIRFGTADLGTVSSAHAYHPGNPDGYAGDVWLNNNQNTGSTNLNQDPGSFGFATMIHEIGHAIGLKHPGNYNAGGGGSDAPFLPASEDNLQHTVMAYSTHPSQATHPRSLLLYDIAAIQYLYGANMTTRTGNDTYAWNPNENFIEAIWDAGGNDTIDASNQFRRAIIDLRAGKFSSVGSSNNSDAKDNLAIAFNVTIENATGGFGDDEMIGNDVRNILDGGSGSDRMSGGKGDDFYRVNSIGDILIEENGHGTDEVESQVSYTLSNFVENLVLIGSNALNGIGNSSANRVEGNIENNVLEGQANSDTLIGDAGDDRLDGGSEADWMFGGSGSDWYRVDDFGDSVEEVASQDIDSVEASINYMLGSHLENLALVGSALAGTGNELNNVIQGNQQDNSLNGLAGNDTLNGGIGSDIMTGGVGADTYWIDIQEDTVVELTNEGIDAVNSIIDYTLSPNLENLTLYGQATRGIGNAVNNLIAGNIENNILHGNLGDDTLNDNTGNDRLNGGSGIDTMSGGVGDDEYWIDQSQDKVTEAANAGHDLVYATATYTLSANVEDLQLTSTEAINGTGNELNNQIAGNSANNALKGEAGNDTLVSAAGDDQLDGGTGVDQMAGGIGNDQYWIDNEDDSIIEKVNEGIDIVHATVDHILKANLENLALTGVANRATGNELNNQIQGNSTNNLLKGMAGNDSLIGYAGDDELDGGAGDDAMHGGSGNDIYSVDSIYDAIIEIFEQGTDTIVSTVSYTLSANVEHLSLVGDQSINGAGNGLDNIINGNLASNSLEGEAGADTLIAHDGNDILNGDLGKDTLEGGLGSDTLKSDFGDDTMIGGKGNDIYELKTVTDRVLELANEGTDSIYTTVSCSLGDNLENLILLESSAINGTGNTLDNQIVGNSAINYLSAGSGNDRVAGGAGDDYLYGETGDDILVSGFDNDTAKGGDGNDQLTGEIGNDWLMGDVGNDILSGDTGKDRLMGGLGDDKVTGGDNNDSLFGDAGDDVIVGGSGRDWLTGGAGGDRFVLTSAQQGVDTIKDFVIGRDKIVLDRNQFTTLNRIRFDVVETLQQAKRSQFQLTYIRSKGALFYNENGSETGFGTTGGQLLNLGSGLDLRARNLSLAVFSQPT